MSNHRRLLGISGSLRKGSYSSAVLSSVRDLIQAQADLEIFDLATIPLYCEDDDGDNAPTSVRNLKSGIANCEALVIVSPEYNYGMPGVLKNALDWASRPGYHSVLKDKPVMFITCSPAATGGVRAFPDLRKTLSACLAELVPGQEIVIARVNEKLKDGILTDEPTCKLIVESVENLLKWTGDPKSKLAEAVSHLGGEEPSMRR